MRKFLLSLVSLIGPMAVITNTELTYSDTSIREDLTDVIYNISPEETVFMSMIGRSKAKNVLHEWQLDELEAPVTTNKQLEGDDVDSFDAVTQPSRVGNYVQISRKTLIVGDTTEAVDHAGINSIKAYNLAKKSKELKRDMEATMLANQAANAGAAGTARATAGLPAWLFTNTDFEGTGSDPVYTSVPTDPRNDGVARAFTETILKSVIEDVWTAGGTLKKLLVGSFNKQVVSGFAGIADKHFNINTAKQATIIGAADVYVSDFGVLEVIPSRWQRGRDAFLVDPEFASVMYLRPFKRVPLAKTGDAEKAMLIVEWGLKVHNEAAHGGVYDLTTS